MRIHFVLLFIFCLASCREEAAVAPQDAPSGRMLFIEVDGADQHVSAFDIESGTVKQLFTADPNGFISHFAVSPDASQLLLAYAAPPPAGEIQFGYTSLFLTSLDDTAVLTPLSPRAQNGESFFNPVWSPDSTTLLYTHIQPDPINPTQFDISLESLSLETEETTLLVENAIWPRYSPSGSSVAYITVEQDVLGNGLWLADANGDNAVQIVMPEQFTVVDVPMFSPDESYLYFTASENEQARRRWWEILLGVETAEAHNIPSDWYRVSTDGGQPERLTAIEEVGIYGAFAPDGRTIGFASFNGLYTMQRDGTDIVRVLTRDATPSFAWIELDDAN